MAAYTRFAEQCEYQCGDDLFEDAPEALSALYIHRGLICGMPQERHYYSSHSLNFPPVCSCWCAKTSEEAFVDGTAYE
jgi:hypothetical protein